MSSPEVSFVIGTFNSEDHIEACLESVYAQEYDGDFEVIVVDNDSDDSTVQIVRNNFPEVQLIVLPHSDYGLCEMYNIGFSSAEGEFIAKLDDDVEINPEWLNVVLEASKSDDVGAVTPKVIEKDDSVLFDSEGLTDHYKGCSALFKTKILNEIGYFEEGFIIGREDHEFSHRMLTNDYKIKKAPKAVTNHKSDNIPGKDSFSKRRFMYNTRNILWIDWKYQDRFNALINTSWRVSRRLLIANRKEAKKEWFKAIIGSVKGLRKYAFREYTPNKDLEYEYRRWNLREFFSSMRNIVKHFK
jgi:GT2 family glycosyltransferase